MKSLKPLPVPVESRLLIENLLNQFSYLVDHGQGPEIQHLFTEGGKIIGPAINCVGRTEIAEFFEKRPKERVTRHIWSNLQFLELEESRISTTSYVVVHARNVPEPNGYRTYMIGEQHDVFIQTSAGEWLFQERKLEPIFAPEEQPKV